MKALVVDDSWITRKVICKMLTRFGIDSYEAANGSQALETLNSNSDIKIAFVDWNMPVMTGIEFLNQAKKDSRFDSIKIVMVTGNNEMDHVKSALNSGVDEYIMLPLTKEILQEKLALLNIHPEDKCDFEA